MRVLIDSYFLPKAGNALSEYEDAYFPTRQPGGIIDRLRVAVADGATETSFAAAWANFLVRAYCRRTLEPECLAEGLKRGEKVWRRLVHRRPLPWYAEQKVADGAFAAIVGLEVHREARRWEAWAVGDCCLFQTRGDTLVEGFPMTSAEQFDNRPTLLSSLAKGNQGIADFLKSTRGTWLPGDVFYLMSDALAAWFYRYSALKGTNAVEYLRGITNQAAFAEFVALQRADRLDDDRPVMRNDDVTLMVCSLE